MRFWLKTIFILAVLGGVGGGASYLTWRVVKKRYAPADAVKVRVEKVTLRELAETISAPGVIQPRKNVKIGAKIMARIIEIPVEEGDTVSGETSEGAAAPLGAVLVRLDDRDLRSRLRAAKANRDAMNAQLQVEKATLQSQEADLAGLEANFRQAQLECERKESLLASKDIAQAAYDEAKSRFESEQARLAGARLRLEAARYNLDVLGFRIESADADIEQAEEALEYTVIRAPISGAVTTINAEEGEMVVTGTMNNAGTVIMEIADLDSMILVAEVDEAEVGKVAPGQEAVVHVQAYPGQDIKGVVETISLTHRNSNRGTKYYRTEIRLDDSEVTLYSGLTADVDIRTHLHEGVLAVPSQAVLGRKVDDLPEAIRLSATDVDTEKTFATVVYRLIDGKAVVTPVSIGPADMTRTIVLSGLEVDAPVITGPYKILNTLKHDQKVELQTDAEARAAEAKTAKKSAADKKKT